MESTTMDGLRRELAAKQATVDALMQGFRTVDFPIVDGLAFDVDYRPAATAERLGGDWYDIFTLPDGRIAFSLGDVCGRGLPVAVKMGQAKQAIKVAASLNDPMPTAVLAQANTVIFLNDRQAEMTTALYGVIDTSHTKVTYASAGHPPPILAKLGEEPVIMPNHGFPLGVKRRLPDVIREHEFVYGPGTLLVLYTDGLIEFGHDALRGEAKLLTAVREAVDGRVANPATFIVESVLRDEETRYVDDIAIMTIRFERP